MSKQGPKPKRQPRRPVVEEIEPRILYSADFAPGLVDAATTPAPAAEQRILESSGEFTHAATQEVQARRHEIAFVDPATPEYDKLIEDIRGGGGDRDIEVVLLDAGRDGIRQITTTLAGRADIDAVHIVSHGTDGAVQLGKGSLDFASLLKNAAKVKGWGDALTGSADILIYGCDVAASAEGRSLVEALARLTGADVAASGDRTGHADLGGDWDLELHAGQIETSILFSQSLVLDWRAILPATVAVDTVSDTADGTTTSIAALLASPGADGRISLREAILAANATANVGGADVIRFDISGAGLHTISLSAILPDITDSVLIDGRSEPDFAGTPVIELRGGGTVANALNIAAGGAGSTIRGFVISGFSTDSIVLTGGNNLIAGNYIGTNAAGSAVAATPNADGGIRILTGSNNNTIGGTTALDRNVIAGNGGGQPQDNEISLHGGSNLIIGNYIGVAADGVTVIGNLNDGVDISTGATDNIVGGLSLGEGNLIAGHTGGGVRIQNDATGSLVRGNTIWANGSGVAISGAGSTGHLIQQNSIHDNTGLGIDLLSNGVTLNDGAKTVGQPNLLMDFPVIQSVTLSGTTLTVSGYVGTGPGDTDFAGARVEFFKTADTAGANGEGQTYLGFLTANASGNFSGTLTVSGLAAGERITAAATDGSNNTSEFGVNVTVNAGNAAPTLTNGATVNLVGTNEDTTSSGTTVNAILTGAGWADADGGVLKGIAVTAVSGNGTWQYSTNGITWTDFGSVLGTAALLLDSGSQVRYVPDGYNGEGASFSFRAWDHASGSASANGSPSTANPGAGGGTSAYSSQSASSAIVVTSVNDAPVLADTLVTLNAVNEDAGAPVGTVGTLISAMVGGVSDVDSVALKGIAITAADASNGTWWYSTNNGSSWSALGTPSAASSRLLASDAGTRVYFQPNANYNGTLATAITFRAWDQTSGSNGGTGNTAANGGATPFSSATDTAGLTVIAVNDAPVLSGVTGDGLTYIADSGAQVIEQGADAAVTDLDSADFDGGSLTVGIIAGGDNTEDVLSVRNQGGGVGQIGFSTGDVTYGGTVIGNATGGIGGTPLSITFNGNATPTAIRALLRNITYQNTDAVTPMTGFRSVSFDVSDGDGGSSAGSIASVTVALNSAPIAGDDSYSVDEDGTIAVDWWDTDWTRRSQITFTGNNFGGATDLTDFPVLIALNSTNIDYVQTQDQGQDLRFLDADGTSLAYEIESWNESGISSVWVKVPQVDMGASDSIWMYYGNASASAGQNPSRVWTSAFSAVYHLNDAGATIEDSTGNAFDSTAVSGAASATGYMAGGLTFDGLDDRIDLGADRSFISGVSSATLSAWLYTDSIASNHSIISLGVGNGGVPSDNSRAALELSGDDIKVIGRSTDAEGQMNMTTTGDVLASGVGSWHYLTGVIDYANDSITIYMDGVQQAATGTVNFSQTTTPTSGSASANAGASDAGIGLYFDGLLDEVRVAVSARSAAWVRAEYLSMTGSFATVGAAQSVGAAQGVLGNDSDPNSDALAAVLVSGPSNASSFTLDADGTFTYTPIADFAGTDTFTYRANDGTSNSNLATVTITVSAFNDAPVLADTVLTLNPVNEDAGMPMGAVGTLVSALVGGISDVDSGAVKGIAITAADASNGTWWYSTDNGSNWNALGTPIAASSRLLASDLNTRVYHQPNANYNGTLATAITFRGWDQTSGSNGGTGNTAANGGATPFSSATDTASLTVNPVNDAPIGLPTITGTVTEDQTLAANAAGIADADGLGAFSYQWLRDGVAIGGATAGTYTLGDADVGMQISVQVFYTDGYGTNEGPLISAQTAPVANVNDAPTVANAIPNQNATEDTAFNFQFAANTFADADVGNTLTYSAQLAGGGALPAWLSLDAVTRTFSGTPSNAEVGTVSIDVIADDGNGGSVTDTFNIVVANVNDAPTVANAIPNQNATEDTAFNFQFAANTFADADVGNTLTYSAQLAGGGALPAWLSLDAVTRTFSGTPSNAEVGTVSIDVIADDGNGGSVTDTFNIVVANVNDAPTVANAIPNQNATEDTAFNFQFAANTFADADVGNTLTYSAQLAGGGALPAWLSLDAVTRTFSGTPSNAEAGTVSIDVIADDGNGGSVTDTFNIVVANANDAPTGVPTIVGTVTEDQTLTANTAGIADADGLGAFSYQWLRNGAAITSATASTYTLGDADVGTQISVQVSYTDGHGTSEGPLTSAQTAAVANVNDVPIGLPTITGTVTEDQTLTANTSGITDADGLGAFSYQWLRNGAAITGATASTYTLGDADVGTPISVQVSYTDAHGTSEGPLVSAQTAAVVNVNDAPTGVPTITGTVTEDQTLTANTSGITDADGLGAFSYQWLRNGAAITSATASTYTLGDADVGTQISVQVSYTDAHGTSEGPLVSARTAAVVNVNDAPTGVPTISGAPTEDQTLTANTAGIADADGLGAFSYQWLRNGVAIAGATSGAYTLGDADTGTLIQVRVSYTDGHATPESLTSASVGPVVNVNDAPTGVVSITGTATEDQTLSADTSTLADADGLGALTYQWARSSDGGVTWVGIVAATAGSYTLGDADVGNLIQVSVGYVDAQGTAESLTSASAGPVANVNDAPVLTANSLSIGQGATQILSGANLGASDVDDAAGTLTFTVSSVANGRFELSSMPGMGITSFTQADVAGGLVVFVQDGSALAPSYAVTVSDGALVDGPELAGVSYTPRATVAVIPVPPSPPVVPPTPVVEEPPAVSEPAVEPEREAPAAATARVTSAVFSPGRIDPPEAQFNQLEMHGLSVHRLMQPVATLNTFVSGPHIDPTLDLLAAAPVNLQYLPTKPVDWSVRPAFPDAEETPRDHIDVLLEQVQVGGMALSVGVVWWASRVSGLLGSLLASAPAWRHIDPLPVVGRDEDEDEKWYDPDDRDADANELAIANVLDGAQAVGDEQGT